MKKSFDKISESLNTETDIVDITPTKSEIVKSNKDDLVDQIKKDYEYTRGNLYSLIE